ncbi:hypothetical protein SKA26_14680 [Enterococcus faecium]
MDIKEWLFIATNADNTLHDVSKFELSQLYKLEYEKYIKITKVKKQGFNKRLVQFEQGEYFKYIIEGKPSKEFTEEELEELEDLRNSYDLEFHDELHYLIKKYPNADIKANYPVFDYRENVFSGLSTIQDTNLLFTPAGTITTRGN